MQSIVPGVSMARQPRGMVRVRGTKYIFNANGDLRDTITTYTVTVPGWVSIEVDNNTYYQADTFRVEFLVSQLPKDLDLNWWYSQSEIFVEVFGGVPKDANNYASSDLESWIYGRADDLRLDPVAGVLTVTGRDLTSYFIDTRVTDDWLNHTASKVADELATKYGLQHDYISPTKDLIGTNYQIDRNLVTNQSSEWDLLTFLAMRESYVVYCKGQALHFEPGFVGPPDFYELKWESPNANDGFSKFNGEAIQINRSLTVAKGVVVWVQGLNLKTGKVISECYPTSNKGRGTLPGQSSPRAAVYTFRPPGISVPADAQKYAQAKHKELSFHELRLTATLPGDNSLTTQSVIRLSGTASPLDQFYFPRSISRRMSVREGYTMFVTANNVAKVNDGVFN